MNIAFVGFKHLHTAHIYQEVKKNPDIKVFGAWEDTDMGKKMASGIDLSFNYPTFEDVLADDRVDTICLGGCYGERGPEAIAALKAGKHVYADKPICTHLEELDEIEKLSKEKNLKIGCYFTLRFSGGMKSLREMIMNGTLGKIGAINITAQHPLYYERRPKWYFEEGKHGGTINDIGIHGVDIVRFLTGLGVEKVTAARTWNHFAEKAPNFKDCGQFMAELENGAGLTADVSYAAPLNCGGSLETYWRMTFWGTGGVAEYKLNGSPILKVALNGYDNFVNVEEPQKYDAEAINEFVREINGETDIIINTADVLRTSRDILNIQAVADR